MPRTRAELKEALTGLAYQFVMLEESVSRVLSMVRLANSPQNNPKAGREGADTWDDEQGRQIISRTPAVTTSGDSIIAYLSQPQLPSKASLFGPQSLMEYRAYLEWALLLARKLNEVLSRTDSRFDDDVLAHEFIGEPTYKLAALDDAVLTRIDKLVAHQTYPRDALDKHWPIPHVQTWAEGWLALFTSDLREADDELCDTFATALAKYRDESKQWLTLL